MATKLLSRVVGIYGVDHIGTHLSRTKCIIWAPDCTISLYKVQSRSVPLTFCIRQVDKMWLELFEIRRRSCRMRIREFKKIIANFDELFCSLHELFAFFGQILIESLVVVYVVVDSRRYIMHLRYRMYILGPMRCHYDPSYFR